MRALFAKHEAPTRRGFIFGHTPLRRAAAAALISACLLGAAMAVPQVRAYIQSLLISITEKFTSFSFDTGEASQAGRVWEPSFIPDGYAEHLRLTGRYGGDLEYINSAGEKIYYGYGQSGTVSIDNENRDYSVLEIDGTEYHIYLSADGQDRNTVFWTTEEAFFTLTSNIDVETLIAMAKSVE